MDDLDEMIKSLKGPIAVLGANGFIGKNMVKRLKKVRQDVLEGTRKNLWGVVDKRPKTVFNLIAYGSSAMQTNRFQIYETNFFHTMNILNHLESHGNLSAYVHAGTSAEYGLVSYGSTEECPTRPNTDYAVSKAMCANLIWYLGKHKAMPVSHLRLYAVYGPYDSDVKLVPRLVYYGMQGLYPTVLRASIKRDFIHVDDVCEAFVRAALLLPERNYGEPFNIGTGRSLEMKEIANIAKTLFGIKGKPKYMVEEWNVKWDVLESKADIQKSKLILGFNPKITFEDGLKSLAEFEQQFNGYAKGRHPI